MPSHSGGVSLWCFCFAVMDGQVSEALGGGGLKVVLKLILEKVILLSSILLICLRSSKWICHQ